MRWLWKRALATICVLAFCLTLMPATAFAEEEAQPVHQIVETAEGNSVYVKSVAASEFSSQMQDGLTEILTEIGYVGEYDSTAEDSYAQAFYWVTDPGRNLLSSNVYPQGAGSAIQFHNGQGESTDPLHAFNPGKSYYYYAEIEASRVDWILKNILNVEPTHSSSIYEQTTGSDVGDSVSRFYYWDGKYFRGWGDVGWLGIDVISPSIFTDGEYYYVEYRLKRQWETDVQTQYAILRPVTVDGQDYWSVVKTSASELFRVVQADSGEYFAIGRDTNRFAHIGGPYRFSNTDYAWKLLENAGWKERFQILDYLDGENRGVCHGLALSMVYASQGLLDYGSITPGAISYWSLGSYYSNTPQGIQMKEPFFDVLLYYTLNQLTTNGEKTASISKDGWHITSLESRLTAFLMQLVEEAQRSQQESRPFVFGYVLPDGSAHAVVVCGYQWDEGAQQHKLKIYDENDYVHQMGSTGERPDYRWMTVSSDYKSFSFQDGNLSSEGRYLESAWGALRFWGLDSIYNTVHQVNASSADKTDATGLSMEIFITAGEPFSLENAAGETLSYDGSNYSGDMKILGSELESVEGQAYWRIKVNMSQSFRLWGAGPDCRLVLELGGQGYSVTASGADYVELKQEGVAVVGDSVGFEVSLSSPVEQCLMCSLSGQSKGAVALNIADNTITLDSQEGCSGVQLKKYVDVEPIQIEVEGNEDKISIALEEQGTTVNGEYIPDFIFTDDTSAGAWTWASKYIYACYNAGVISGISNGNGTFRFEPDSGLTRAQAAVLFCEAMGLEGVTTPSAVFTDDTGAGTWSWAAKYIYACKQAGIISGYENGTFRPDKTITRAEFSVMMAGALQLSKDVSVAPFPDDTGAGTWKWAGPSIYACKAAGIVSGDGSTGKFNPDDTITRAQAAVMMAEGFALV